LPADLSHVSSAQQPIRTRGATSCDPTRLWDR